jgi:5'-3' exonuclease
MLNNDSPIIDYYPEDFDVDPNGEKVEWKYVILVPFIEEERLLKATTPIVRELFCAIFNKCKRKQLSVETRKRETYLGTQYYLLHTNTLSELLKRVST